MEYCCHARTGTASHYLDILDKIQKRYAGLLVFHLLALLSFWLITDM